MDRENIYLPLFALPVFLLVGGRTRLRVFEPRYIKLVTLATQGDGFIISAQAQENPKQFTQSSENNSYFGCWVKIVNFDQDNNGTLEIDVQCHKVVKFTFADRDTDKLTFVDATSIEHWSEQSFSDNEGKYTEQLRDVIQKTPLLRELYHDTEIEGFDAYGVTWEVARWLEILPLPEKHEYFYQLPYREAVNTLEKIIF